MRRACASLSRGKGPFSPALAEPLLRLRLLRRLCSSSSAAATEQQSAVASSGESTDKSSFVPRAEDTLFVIDRRRYKKEMTAVRKEYMAEMEAIAEEKRRIEAEIQRQREIRQTEKAAQRAKREAELRIRFAREAEERRIRNEEAFQEQMQLWRQWKHNKQDEMREELECLMVKESPEWIVDPEQITDETFSRQVLLDGFWPERNPLYMKGQKKKAYEKLLKSHIPLDSRLGNQIETEEEKNLRFAKEGLDELPVEIVFEGEDGEWTTTMATDSPDLDDALADVEEALNAAAAEEIDEEDTMEADSPVEEKKE